VWSELIASGWMRICSGDFRERRGISIFFVVTVNGIWAFVSCGIG
jgi:hypothetical protein